MNMESVVVGIITKLLTRTPIFIHDESEHIHSNLYQPFAFSDVFLREVNRDVDKTILHIWPMEQVVILGMMDRRLPYCDEGIKAIRTHGYRAVVRNVGGLAVVADTGVLNFSFILPKRTDSISIQEAYLLMTQFIQAIFVEENVRIEHYVIKDSYCPGDFDLSISGKKFAGIAQRRFKDGIAISIYLSVCGNQMKRGELIKTFYQYGKKNEKTKFSFPQVNPSSMANLCDLLHKNLTVEEVKHRILDTLQKMNSQLLTLQLDMQMKEEYKLFYDKMIERNRKI
ncbi:MULTISPECIES: lipoate--protein ligase family protein [unclassified Granulicatella]|uniref:lipoate--protein ligase family protein n=1 Tax=unclassified Granulicatella TaxID=2630493 RepID=UPI001072EFC6|nr:MULTISPECIES: lipoate--protein ligase family protein [unclassified Granulicatella]MBF0780826.1 lipoate--protein ligase family protein [Granulicatella sp. 19428wC4_WM01]TFU93533.1 lipoate--protein ligase family protein [Granulicatella sp. WM01]